MRVELDPKTQERFVVCEVAPRRPFEKGVEIRMPMRDLQDKKPREIANLFAKRVVEVARTFKE